MEGFKVIIAADASQGINAVAKFNAELGKTNLAGAKVGAAVTKVNASFNSVKGSSNTAGLALLNLGRIAQDAPFGFIGISNNINPLLESFQRLKAESGSTGTALKSLVAGLAGGAGLGLAVSIATGLLTVFGDRLFKTKKTAEDGKKANEEFAKSTQAIVSSITEEATRVSVLVTAIKSEILTKGQRKGAIDELKRISPDYFTGLKDEKDLIEKVTKAYKGYISSLTTQFKAKALSNQLQLLFDKQLKLEIALDPTIGSINNAQIQRRRNEIQAELSKLPPVDFTKDINVFELTEAEKHVRALHRELESLSGVKVFDFSNRRKELQETNLQIIGLLPRLAELTNFDITTKEIKPPKVTDWKRAIEAITNVGKFGPEILDPTVEKLGLFGDKIKIVNTSLATLQIPLKAGASTLFFDEAMHKAETLATYISSTLQPVFSAVFETIASGGQSALQALGNALKAIIVRLAAAAATALIFATIMALATGGTSAAISKAVGTNFKALFGQLSGFQFAEGGIAMKPTFGMFGERGPEAVIPLRDLNRVLGSIGGGFANNINVVVHGILRGPDIYLSGQKAKNQFGGTFS